MSTTHVGMDVRARTIQAALLKPGAKRPEEWQLEHEPRAVKRLAQRLKRGAGGALVGIRNLERGPDASLVELTAS